MKRGGVIIPRRIRQYVAPVTGNRIHDELTAWDRLTYGIDVTPARLMSLNNVYVRTIEPSELLDAGRSAKEWDAIDLTSETKAARKGEISWKLSKAQSIYGFAVWWSLDLADGVSLSTAPGAPRTHWEQLYFPLEKPLTFKSGESILASLRSRSSEAEGTHLAWTAVHFDAQGRSLSRQAMDLNKGWIP